MSDWSGEERGRPRKSFEAEVEELLAEEPFEPFFLVMNSGERFAVTSQHSLSSTDTVYIVYTRDGTSRLRRSAISHIDVPEAMSDSSQAR